MIKAIKNKTTKYVRKLKESTFIKIISNYHKYKKCCESMNNNANEINNIYQTKG